MAISYSKETNMHRSRRAERLYIAARILLMQLPASFCLPLPLSSRWPSLHTFFAIIFTSFPITTGTFITEDAAFRGDNKGHGKVFVVRLGRLLYCPSFKRHFVQRMNLFVPRRSIDHDFFHYTGGLVQYEDHIVVGEDAR